MSAARSRREADRPVDVAERRPDMDDLRARRRHARRHTRLARLDLGIGVGAALMLFIISPGLAITGIVALLTLLACGISLVLERRHAKGKPLLRRSRSGRRTNARAAAPTAARRPRSWRSVR